MTMCKCHDVAGNVWTWNASQCAAVQILMFQNTPRLRDAPKADQDRANEEWRQMARFLTVHLGLFGVENILKGLIEKYDLPSAGSEAIEIHPLGKLYERLPTRLRAVWRNSYMNKQKDRGLDEKVLDLVQVMGRYSKSYTDARYHPGKVDTREINLYTFLDIIESGLDIFTSETCYCPEVRL